MYKLCRVFNGGKTSAHYESQFGWPSDITEDLTNKVIRHIYENRRFTIDELHK